MTPSFTKGGFSIPMGKDVSDNHADRVVLRDVQESDLPILFEHQNDPMANRMAAFPARAREEFMAHWARILGDDTVIARIILLENVVAGNIVCFEQAGKRLIGYWIGTQFWGKGIATKALSEFLAEVGVRPLRALVAKHNLGSIRVLEKCGFIVSGKNMVPYGTEGKVIEELEFTLVKQIKGVRECPSIKK